MTTGRATTFRLLDPWVGWQPEGEPDGLTGFTGTDGLRLATTRPGPSRDDLLAWFPDPRLAPAGRGAWYLLATGTGIGTGNEPDDGHARLLRRDPCTGDWLPVWSPACDPHLTGAATSVAAAAHHLVLVTGDRILSWDGDGRDLIGDARVRGARLAAVTARGQVVAGSEDAGHLWLIGPAAAEGRPVRTGVPGRLAGLRVIRRTIWLLAEDPASDELSIWNGSPGKEFTAVDPAELAERVPASNLAAAWTDGFCLAICDAAGERVLQCADWSGRPLDSAPPTAVPYRTAGSFETQWIDSGISRCRWHRVRLDASIGASSTLAVRVAVAEKASGTPDGWQDAPVGSTDFLVDLPPGQRLKLRLELRGDGTATPVVHRIRLDLPRVTSADLLPAAFRQDPAADDFTERFLSLFDSSLSDLDRMIERYPALLDSSGTPDSLLSWLGGLLGLGFDAGWPAAVRRGVLAQAPSLYRRRGTPGALRDVIEIVTGTRPGITELAAERAWASPGTPGTVLGAVRLFGGSTARVRLGGDGGGGSALGHAPLRSGGDPAADAVAAHAFRFRVTLPPGASTVQQERALAALVARQAPAHTVGSVRSGGLGLVVGMRSAVEVDTALVPLPVPVLGSATAGGPGPGGGVNADGRVRPARLSRSSVLQPGRHGPRAGIATGTGTAVGAQTLAW